MARFRVRIEHYDESKPVDTVVVGLGERVRAREELSEEQQSNEELLWAYQVWLAAKRQGVKVPDFAEWWPTVADAAPKLIESGESPAPPTS